MLSVAISDLQIKCFTHKHKLHFLTMLEYDLACFTFGYLMLKSIFCYIEFVILGSCLKIASQEA